MKEDRKRQLALQVIQTDRRTLTWVERGSEILRYLGYIAVGIISLYLGYCTGIFKCMFEAMPKTICLRLFCVKAVVNTAPNVTVQT